MASVASAHGFHHPPMPVAQPATPPVTPPVGPAKVGPGHYNPGQPGYHPVYAQSHARSVPSQCNSPGVAVRMTRVPQPTNFAFHMARPKATPNVQSARLSTRGSFGGYGRAGHEAEAADWLPASCGAATWQATQRQAPPSSPPALIPKTQQAESRSPSPPHTPARSPPNQQEQPMGRARTDVPHPAPSPKFFAASAPFERSVSDGDRISPSPPLPRRTNTADLFSPQMPVRPSRMVPPGPVGRVERRFSLPVESSPWFSPQEMAAAMAPVPQDRPSDPIPKDQSPWPVNPPPLKPMVAPMVRPMVQPPPPPAASPVASPAVSPEASPSRAPVEVQNVTRQPSLPKDGDSHHLQGFVGAKETQPESVHEAEFQHVPSGPSGRRASRLALVPIGHRFSDGREGVSRSKHLSLGALQCNGNGGAATCPPVQPLNDAWLPPNKSAGGTLERSELGSEITTEVRRWLRGRTSGLQCSHVVMDKALTVLSNFKLSSGCELEVLGGPLGAIIGGYNEEDWLYQEIFSKDPGQALEEAFQLLGFPSDIGDWSGYMVEEISLAYRRQCLRGHPSRGGSARNYLKLQVAMELIRAFDQELALEADASPEAEPEAAWSPMTRRKRKVHGFVLDDLALVRELELSQTEAAMEADTLPAERLEELNRALDEYILRQMCFKSEIVAEIARLHENSAYSILGVSPEASDAEIKKAYRLVAMQCHPDKGGDKAEFQELHEAYEKIMEQRRSSANLAKSGGGPSPESSAEAEPPAPKAEEEAKAEEEEEVDGEEEADEKEESEADAEEDGGDSQLLAKSGKAAEEASRYAKTAADFAHQAAEAAETARQGRQGGNALPLTKSIAHSAIVLTLTVVKAVRVVGYATMDVAAQCRLAARKCNSAECAESSTEAMGLGLEALNAALSCAEVTEVTAAELSRDADSAESEDVSAERFIAAAVRASLAAASASNAAMSAAIAAVEGNRQCIQAAQPAEDVKDPKPQETEEEKSVKSDADGHETARSDQSEPKASESPEEQGLKRQINQRSNNHKVLLRLNAEILLHQQNVRQFLQANRQLIPEVSCEAKGKVQTLLRDYAHEVQLELNSLHGEQLVEELPTTLSHSGLLAPLLQRQVLAIPVCPKARVLKMAALYDLQMTFQVLEQEIFEPARQMLLQANASTQSLDEVTERIQKELQSYTDGG